MLLNFISYQSKFNAENLIRKHMLHILGHIFSGQIFTLFDNKQKCACAHILIIFHFIKMKIENFAKDTLTKSF